MQEHHSDAWNLMASRYDEKKQAVVKLLDVNDLMLSEHLQAGRQPKELFISYNSGPQMF